MLLFPRITPAYAGKSFNFCSHSVFRKDHPRLCGEKWKHFIQNYQELGSPPPMRGKASLNLLTQITDGITPAYAGKRVKKSVMRSAGQDHPRLCGEKRKLSRLLIFSLGSPPPMRGKECGLQSSGSWNRITPAYAGKRRGKGLVRHRTQDHPRLCGEKLTVAIYSHLFSGSPPPMRGKALRAGFVLLRNQDHPRLCGEKSEGRYYRNVIHGITPAYAGKSCRS